MKDDTAQTENAHGVQRLDLPNGARLEVHVHASPPPADQLVRKPGPLEAKAWQRAAREGRLPVVTLGRHEYAKASDLVRLVDTLGAEQRSKKAPKLRAVEPVDALTELAAATRKRGGQ